MVKKEESFQQALNGIRSSTSSSSSTTTTANSAPTTSINYLLNNNNFKNNSKENINHSNYNLLSSLPINTAQLLLPTTTVTQSSNTINNSNNYTEMQNLATMANVANQLVAAAAAGNPIICATNPNDVTQVYFQNANELAYKIPANAVHFMNAAAAHQHMNGANSNTNKDNTRETRDLHHNKNHDISSKLNGSSSSNSSNAGESVIEETVKKREMRLMKNR